MADNKLGALAAAVPPNPELYGEDDRLNEQYSALKRAEAMLTQALEARVNPSAPWIAAAQGFTNPGNPGAYFGGIVNAMGNYAKSKAGNQDILAENAKIRYELAAAGLEGTRRAAAQRQALKMFGGGDQQQGGPRSPSANITPEAVARAQLLDKSTGDIAEKLFSNQQGQTKVTESGVYDMRTGQYRDIPNPSAAQKEIFVPELGTKINMTDFNANKLAAARAEGRAEQFLRQMGIGGTRPAAPRRGPTNLGEYEVEQKTQQAAAAEIGKEQGESTANFVKSARDATEMEQSAKRAKAYIARSPNMVGVFNKPNVRDALFSLVASGVNAGTTNFKPGDIQQFARQVGVDTTPEDLTNLNLLAREMAVASLSYRKLFLSGSGAVSNMEQQVVERIPGDISDTPQALMAKMSLIEQGARVRRQLGEEFRRMQEDRPGLTLADFERTPESKRIKEQYNTWLERNFFESSPGAPKAAPSGGGSILSQIRAERERRAKGQQ